MMSVHQVSFDISKLNNYIQNDCKVFDRETMNLGEYFLNGKIVKLSQNQEMPANVGKTDYVVITKPVEKRRSIFEQDDGLNNYTKIILADNVMGSVISGEENPDNSMIVKNNYLKSSHVYDKAPPHKEESVASIELEAVKLIEPTCHDYDELTPKEQLIYDNRVFVKYLKTEIVEEHRIINIVFKSSLLHPFFTKINKLVFELSSGLAINALIYTADYIDKRATANDKVSSLLS
jgi:hypothetical protein